VVSTTSLIKIGGIGLAVALGYVALKNAGSIGAALGSSVGGGLASGFKGISDSFTNAFNFGNAAPIGSLPDGHQSIPTIDGINTKEDIIVQAGGVPKGNDSPIALVFKDFIDDKLITPEFARSYSFQPNDCLECLDVSDTFRYISESSNNISVKRAGELAASNFGGYGTAEAQQVALVKEIAKSAEANGDYFV